MKNMVERLLSIADTLDSCRNDPYVTWTKTNSYTLLKSADDARQIANDIALQNADALKTMFDVISASTSKRVAVLSALSIYVQSLYKCGLSVPDICADIDRICSQCKTAVHKMGGSENG